MSHRLRAVLLVVACAACGDSGAPEPVRSAGLAGLEAGVRAPIEALLAELEGAPGDAALLGELAVLYQANGLGDAVEAAYAQALAHDPSQARWWYGLCLFRRAEAELEAAVEACRRAIELAPEYHAAQRTLVSMLLDLGQVDEARAAAEAVLAASPEAPASVVALARVELRERNWAEAVRLLERVLELEPRYGYAHMLLGRAYLGAGETEKARLASSRGKGAPSPDFDPWASDIASRRGGLAGRMKLAERHFQERDDNAAIRVLVKLREDYPDEPMVLSNLASAYSRQGQIDSMLAVLRQALELDPDHFATHVNLSHGYLAKGDPVRALEHARRALELNPTQALAQAQIAEVLYAQGELDAALEALDAAIALTGDPTRYRTKRAEWLQANGRHESAVAAWRTVLEAKPSSVKARHGLVRTLASAGRVEEAWAELDTARRLAPDHAGHAAVEAFVAAGGDRE